MTEDNRVNVFLLCVSALELLVLQVFYMRGKVKWEALWVIFIECAAYGAGIVSPGEGIVVFELENGMYIEWLRNAACPKSGHRRMRRVGAERLSGRPESGHRPSQ